MIIMNDECWWYGSQRCLVPSRQWPHPGLPTWRTKCRMPFKKITYIYIYIFIFKYIHIRIYNIYNIYIYIYIYTVIYIQYITSIDSWGSPEGSPARYPVFCPPKTVPGLLSPKLCGLDFDRRDPTAAFVLVKIRRLNHPRLVQQKNVHWRLEIVIQEFTVYVYEVPIHFLKQKKQMIVLCQVDFAIGALKAKSIQPKHSVWKSPRLSLL